MTYDRNEFELRLIDQLSAKESFRVRIPPSPKSSCFARPGEEIEWLFEQRLRLEFPEVTAVQTERGGFPYNEPGSTSRG